MDFEEQREYNFTIEAIDKKLEEDLKQHARQVRKVILFIILVLAIIFRGNIMYWAKFGFAFHSKTESAPISVMEEPIQNNYTKEEQEKKTFEYKTLLEGNKIKIIPVAYYKISGLVVATNRFFLTKSEFFDDAALYDIGLAWGKLGDKRFYKKYFKSYSRKNEVTGARVLWTTAKTKNMPVTQEYSSSHWSHTHIVPANNNIMGALIRIKTWDKVVLEGMLVDMQYTDKQGRMYASYTSTVRDDGMNGNRGNGNCEVMFVTSVRLGNRIYK